MTLLLGAFFSVPAFAISESEVEAEVAASGNPDNEFIPHWKKYSAADRQTMELNSKGCVCHKDLNNQNLNALRYLYER